MWSELNLSYPVPPPRAFHSAVYDQTNNRMIVFGGCADQYCFDPLNDTWVLTNANGLGGTSAWIQLTPSGSLPNARAYPNTVYDATNNRMIVYGGLGVSDDLSDVWLLTNANGAICKTVDQVTCFAPDYAIVNYQEYQASKHDYVSIRNEFFDDFVGQRTGFKTQYAEETLMWGHWVGSTILLRPEIRFDRSFQASAYDRGTRNSQFQFAIDVIFKF